MSINSEETAITGGKVMRLIIKEFEFLAKRSEYNSGYRLWRKLGGGKRAYKHIKAGVSVGFEVVKALYNKFGEKEVEKVIDFEGLTISSLKSKYLIVGKKLC